ncbi:MAG: SUMF1/EgtB/PvdO family nonheme iron enzyme [Candidatus Cloacimonetes bacterium]|nr:SUMF1/EgtB/PvdO family nonheme iron enzyme [Candidatus Cloacimonadota bacterium]
MKHSLLASILLLLCAGNILAFTGLDEPDSNFITSELRQEPAVPMNLSIVRSGETIILTWDAVTEDTDGSPMTNISYEVHYKDIPDFECNADTLIDTISVPELVLENWTGATDRAFFKVIAVGAGGGPIPGNFVYVPAGTYIMGDTLGEGSNNELPTHSVTLDSFYMDKYLITQYEYTAIMGSNPAYDFGVGDIYPVYNVSWYSAIKYCNLRSMAEGLTPCYTIMGSTNPASWGAVPTSSDSNWDAAICNWSANGYRLPTEAEWEYAARGATNNPDYLYSGSDDIDVVAWQTGNNIPWGTKPVGTKAPNALDIYDMSGNLYEWCWDWFDDSYYGSSPVNNPTGPMGGFWRVWRGGFWNDSANQCRVTNRSSFNPYLSGNSVGFRICRSGL